MSKAVWKARSAWFDMLAVGVAALLLIAFTVPHLADYPVPVDDEIWILSVSHKLASSGVFVDRSIHRLLPRLKRSTSSTCRGTTSRSLAMFKFFGTSILVGRLVSVSYGVVVLGLVYAAGKKLGGVHVAVLALGLMLFLRLSYRDRKRPPPAGDGHDDALRPRRRTLHAWRIPAPAASNLTARCPRRDDVVAYAVSILRCLYVPDRRSLFIPGVGFLVVKAARDCRTGRFRRRCRPTVRRVRRRQLA